MGRAPCCEKVGLKKGKWTAEEDEILTKYIQGNGEGSWRSLPKNAGLLRCGKSCRLRWVNYLKTDLKRGNITTEEEELVIKLHASFGKRWSLIASHLPGRTDNELKNHWNTHLIKKIHTFQGQAGHETLPAMAEVASVSVSTKKKSDKTRKCSMKKNKSKNNKHGNVSTQQRPDKNVSTEEEIQLPATPTQEKETFPSTSIEGCMDLDPLEEEDKNIIINQIISSPCQVISFGEETTINYSMLCPRGEEKHTQTLVPIFEDEILCFNDIMGSTVWTLLDETENCVKNISEEKEIAGMEMSTSSMANISEKIESANNLIKTNGESVACSSITSFFDDDSFDWDRESAIQGHHYQQCDDNEENHLPSLW